MSLGNLFGSAISGIVGALGGGSNINIPSGANIAAQTQANETAMANTYANLGLGKSTMQTQDAGAIALQGQAAQQANSIQLAQLAAQQNAQQQATTGQNNFGSGLQAGATSGRSDQSGATDTTSTTG